MHHKRKNSKRKGKAPLRSKWNQPLWFRRQQRNVRRDRQREIEIPMTFHFHPDNENTPLPKLLRQAIDEVVAMTERHFKHDTTLRASIPARGVDTDVLLMNALHRALDFYEQTDKEGIDD